MIAKYSQVHLHLQQALSMCIDFESQRSGVQGREQADNIFGNVNMV